jgi:Ca2+-binding EF-hand superfamily protein
MGNIPALKAALSDPDSYDKIKTAFKSYDLDRSGHLSRAEFGTFIVNLKTVLATTPHGGALAREAGNKSASEYADTVFNLFDNNRDGKISFDEFESIIMTHAK